METQKKFSLALEDFVSFCCCTKNSKHSPPSRTSEGDHPQLKSSPESNYVRISKLSSQPDSEVRSSPSQPDTVVSPSPSQPDSVVKSSPSQLDSVVRSSPSQPDTVVSPSPSQPDTVVSPSPSQPDTVVRSSPSQPDTVVRSSPSQPDTVVRSSPSQPDTVVRSSPSQPDPVVRPSPPERLEAEPWYFPNTDRQHAEKMLLAEGNQTGAFLIRSSENTNGSFVLSVLDQGKVKHYKVLQLENGHHSLSNTISFPTLKGMVEYYSKQSDGLGVYLCEPCKKVAPTLQPLTISDLEIERSSITLQKRLGAGQFGEVYAGLWNGCVSVAVKILKPDMMQPVDFLKEAAFMKRLRHPKLIQLYAICTLQEPIFIITELMKNGSLLEYLQKDQGATLRVSDLIEMAAQVASGMEFLESQNYIHRDLAARNVLVGENNICKVADFGLARVLKREDKNVYEAREGSKFPVKWTAPETVTSNKFTVKSDVWSFGVLLYEMMTFGQTPYPDMTNLQAVQWVIKGNRLPCPPNCPPAMYSIMMECWKKEEQDRPTFESLQWKLEDLFDFPL